MGFGFCTHGGQPRVQAVAHGHLLFRIDIEVEQPGGQAHFFSSGVIDAHEGAMFAGDFEMDLVLAHSHGRQVGLYPDVDLFALALAVVSN